MLQGTRRALLSTIAEINVTCPTITPTLGAELLTNGNFAAWTGDNPDGWAIAGEVGANPEVSEVGTGEGHGGAGVGVCNIYTTAGAINISQAILSSGDWYNVQIYIDTVVSSAVRWTMTNLGPVYSTTGAKVATQRATNINFYIIQSGFPTDVSFDNVSCKAITFSSMLAYLGHRSHRPGTYQCTPTVAADTQVGILLGYTDSNNFVMAIVDRIAGQAQLIKCIAGTYTSVVAGAITYGAAKVLKVIVASNGTNYSLYYDGAQIGATTAINDAGLGTKVYGFNSYAGNSVGTVTTSKATS